MKRGEKAAFVCCSNGLPAEERQLMERLQKKLCGLGLNLVLSEYLYAERACFSGTGEERAADLQRFFSDPELRMIFDVSGGDIANELLPFLDYQSIAASKAIFCGYSDLTTIMNAIYAKTGKPSLWYQVKHLLGKAEEEAEQRFIEAFLGENALCLENSADDDKGRKRPELLRFQTEFLQGDAMQGVLVGGNIRCLLKLAGTPYWPEMKGKLLFLEARSGSHAQMTAYLTQLKQMGVFEEIQGILLGTFLQLEKEEAIEPDGDFSLVDLVKRCAGKHLPIAKTGELGHRAGSKAVWIGGRYAFSRSEE